MDIFLNEQEELLRRILRVSILIALASMIAATVAWSQVYPTTRDEEHRSITAHRIDLNNASAAELQLLPGVGEILAQGIVEDRNTLGRFQDLEDFKRVKYIGDKIATEVAPHIQF